MHRQYWENPRNIRDIKIRPAYQIGRRLFLTIHAAAKSEAWHLILDKYTAGTEDMRLNSVRFARGLTCSCDLGYVSEYHADYDNCPLHDRETGYFSRLHNRLSKLIERLYNKNVE